MRPLHPLCSHRQSMPCVYSMASHWTLQYLPDVVTRERIGCAHFSVLVQSVCFLLASDLVRMIQAFTVVFGGKCFCTERNTLRYWPHHCRSRWKFDVFRDRAANSLLWRASSEARNRFWRGLREDRTGENSFIERTCFAVSLPTLLHTETILRFAQEHKQMEKEQQSRALSTR